MKLYVPNNRQIWISQEDWELVRQEASRQKRTLKAVMEWLIHEKLPHPKNGKIPV